MAAVGEEDEEPSDKNEQAAPVPQYEAGIRQRELATQKARLVSQMAAQSHGYESASSQDKDRVPTSSRAPMQAPVPPRQPLQSARTVAASVPSTRSPRLSPTKMTKERELANGNGDGEDKVTRIKSRAERTTEGLFEAVRKTLTVAFKEAETANGYISRGECCLLCGSTGTS